VLAPDHRAMARSVRRHGLSAVGDAPGLIPRASVWRANVFSHESEMSQSAPIACYRRAVVTISPCLARCAAVRQRTEQKRLVVRSALRGVPQTSQTPPARSVALEKGNKRQFFRFGVHAYPPIVTTYLGPSFKSALISLAS
jgi:hypothetical protein